MKRILVSVALALLVVVSFAMPVAAIGDPDAAPQINAAQVFELADGGIGVLVDYYIDYTISGFPTETATESYFVVFVDTDGTTQLRAAAPYVFVDSGYGRGLVWIQFTAAEVGTLNLISANQALYRIWLVGNPTLTWVPGPTPPKTIATLDTWLTYGVSVLSHSLRGVLYYADMLELIWSPLDMVQATSEGNKLTATGESYFLNVIPSLRVLAPGAFSSSTADPNYIPISYNTAFGATATSGTATLTVSPDTLVSGTDTIDTGVTIGTITIDLAGWTFGTITNLTGTLTASPTTLYPGVNTVIVTGAGTFTVAVAVQDTASTGSTAVGGTGFDLTTVAARFGMSRWMFSGLIWLALSVAACIAAFGATRRADEMSGGSAGFKTIMTLLGALIIGGTLLGLLHPLVSSLLFIGYGAFIGYVLFFRSDSLHKGLMFMIWMFVIVSIAGNVTASGTSSVVATRLTAVVTDTEYVSITVASTTGFPNAGIVIINDEQITYPNKDATHFLGSVINPIVRGSGGTETVAHATNSKVRTRESWALNASVDYKVAKLVDSAGVLDYIAMPFRLLDLVMTFFVLPLSFLGSDLAVLSYIWMVVAAGMIAGFVLSIVGGRRV